MKRVTRLSWLVGGALVIASVVVVVVLRPREPSPAVAEVRIGTVNEFPPGSVKLLDVKGRFFDPGLTTKVPGGALVPHGLKSTARLILVHDEKAGLLAFLARDPHLGCRVGLVSDLPAGSTLRLPSGAFFLDPCHGETFDRSGGCFEGTGCIRGLDHFGVRVAADGSVIVDLFDFRFGPTPRDDPAR